MTTPILDLIHTTPVLDLVAALDEQKQYQLSIFRTLSKLVIVSCSTISLTYLMSGIQTQISGAYVIGLSFMMVTIAAIFALKKLNTENFIVITRTFLGLATWTAFALGVLDNFPFGLVAMTGSIVIITISSFLDSIRGTYFWLSLNIAGFVIAIVLNESFQYQQVDLGYLEPLMLYGIPIAAIIIIAELGRVTTQHFKMNLIQSEARRQQLMAQSEKLEIIATDLARSNQELQEFAYVASHDLQEPLRKINAFGERLGARLSDSIDEKSLDYLQRMQNAALRMQDLIQGLLAYSRVTTKPDEPTEIALYDVFNDLLQDLDLQISDAQADITIGNLPTIEADKLQMKMLFQNLLSNAIKYRKDDVTPVIKVESQPVAGTPKLVQIIISDNGIGFEETYVDRIFGVFQRLHGRKEYSGSGIGLAICRKIVERHNGKIEAKSVLGEGSKFIVTLPIKQADLERIS